MRRYYIPLCGLLVWVFGCAKDSGQMALTRPEIAPLSESEFETFVERVSQGIVNRLDFISPAAKADVIHPKPELDSTVDPMDGVPDAAQQTRFVGALEEALTDRLAGRVRFVDGPAARYRARVEFKPGRGGRGTVAFMLTDPMTRRDAVRETTTYAVRALQIPAAEKAKVSAATAGGGRLMDLLRIDLPEADLVRASNPAVKRKPYSDWAVRGDSGTILFLDEQSWGGAEIRPYGLDRSSDGPVRVEFGLAARGGMSRAQVRVIFSDDQGRAVEVTPVVEYGLPSGHSTIIAFEARDARATRYLALVRLE